MTVEAEVTLPDGRQVTVRGPTREAVAARIDELRAPAPVPRETPRPALLVPAADPHTLVEAVADLLLRLEPTGEASTRD